MIDFITKIDKKYAIGLITGLLFGLLSIYTDFFRSNKPKVQFDVLSNIEVISLKENISKIQITYDSINILSNKENLNIITLKISNNGNADILKDYYDEKFPLGFIVPNAKILETPVIISTNNNYLKSSIVSKKVGDNKVYFNSFLFEEEDFFIVKILTLHKVGELSTIIPTGRIAGVKGIDYIESLSSQKKTSFWDDVKQTSFTGHLKRFVYYLFIVPVCFVLALFLIITPIALIAGYFDKRSRKRKVKLLKYQLYRELDSSEKYVVDVYIESGIDTIQGLINADLNNKIFRIALFKHLHRYNLENDNKIIEAEKQISTEGIEKEIADIEINASVSIDIYMPSEGSRNGYPGYPANSDYGEKLARYKAISGMIIKLLSDEKVVIDNNRLLIEEKLDSFIKKLLWVANN